MIVTCILHLACTGPAKGYIYPIFYGVLSFQGNHDVLCSSVADPMYCVSMKPQSPRSPSPALPSLLPKPSKHLHTPTLYAQSPRPEHSAFCFVPCVDNPEPSVSTFTSSTPSSTTVTSGKFPSSVKKVIRMTLVPSAVHALSFALMTSVRSSPVTPAACAAATAVDFFVYSTWTFWMELSASSAAFISASVVT